MDQTIVTATPGRALGSRSSRRLRAEGKLPGVVYGLGRDPVTITVGYTELRDALKGDAGMNTVIELDLAGAETETVIVRSVQRDPIKRLVTHADFLRIDATKPIKVGVPITLVGEPIQVLEEGGLIEQNLFEIEVEVSPMSIPSEIEVDISEMTLDTNINVIDLNLPAGVISLVPEEISVVSSLVPRAVKVDEELDVDGELVEGEEGADGEAPEGEGDESADASEDSGE